MHSNAVLEDEKLARMVFRHAVLQLARAAKISSELAVRLERRLPWLLARRSHHRIQMRERKNCKIQPDCVKGVVVVIKTLSLKLSDF